MGKKLKSYFITGTADGVNQDGILEVYGIGERILEDEEELTDEIILDCIELEQFEEPDEEGQYLKEIIDLTLTVYDIKKDGTHKYLFDKNYGSNDLKKFRDNNPIIIINTNN